MIHVYCSAKDIGMMRSVHFKFRNVLKRVGRKRVQKIDDAGMEWILYNMYGKNTCILNHALVLRNCNLVSLLPVSMFVGAS